MSERREGPDRLPGARPRVRALVARASRPALTMLAAAGCVALAALLITRGTGSRHAALTDTEVGQVAKIDIRATQAVYVPDQATTERLRDEAERAAPLVYFYDAAALEERSLIVRKAFGLMREEFTRYDLEVRQAIERLADEGPVKRPREAAGPLRALAARGPSSRAGKALPSRVHRPILDRLLRGVAQKRTAFRKLLPASRRELDTLVRMRFSRLAEDVVVRILTSALESKVVRDKVRFLIDASGRILLRTRGSKDLVPLEKMVNASDVLDIQGARAKIADVAADLVPDTPPPLRDVLVGAARRLVVENLTMDQGTTAIIRKRARDAVPDQFRYFPRETTIVRQGDVISADHLTVLRAMAPAGGSDATRAYFGNALFVALLGVMSFFATRLRILRRRLSGRDYFLVAVTMLFSIFLVRASAEVSDILQARWTTVPLSAFLLAIPVSLGAMLVRLFFAAELAMLFSFVMSLLVGLLCGGNLYFAAYVALGGFAAALLAGRARQRSHLLRAGLWTGLVQVGVVLCLTLASGQGGFPSGETTLVAPPEQGLFALSFLLDIGASLVSGVLAGLLVAALVPVVEASLGYTTDMKFLELANLENPLLRELFLCAPGTYHHSVVAGTLAEAAAEAIGANPSLARVGAYYHDVGKGKCPHYFAENLRGENPHDRLAPHMSALILKSHVRDGVEILRQHKIPEPIIDVCEQHLGTTRIEFFYDKAVRQAEENAQPPPEETDFRYPGPKPQFRESALVFLADSIEAAARAIPEPTEPKLNEMVRRIIRGKFIDGQLEECDLTLRDLNAIGKAMTRVLVAIHHTRPQYPAQVEAEAARAAGDGTVDLAEHRRKGRR